ncbi:metallophosphoesterase [Pusillimonas sp. ANT_WB101]|uniref:metallophosphoesterase n=1 Tax=Pusillimonas sp. ANT_WB101 TaxID=2597356 RepID=UPI0011ED301C|nr:metallophosphoesterase [Pusillimonas sp. ANT_WB101]KAA0911829.1 metallophosphoesterase [Pusillimonas sp. ANT_WB101]
MLRYFSFLLRVPVLLGLGHLYAGWRLAAAASNLSERAVILAAILVMYLLVVAGFRMRRAVGQTGGDLVAWAGFVALGLFAWVFVLCLVRDIVLLLLVPTAFFAPAASVLYFEPIYRASAVAVPVLAIAAVLIGLYNARKVARVVDVNVPITNLPKSLQGFTIVQLSDVHVGATIKRGYIERIVKAVNALQPNAIALTGDLVDGSVASLRNDVEPLSKLVAQHGVYVVTGNHEYYSGAQEWVNEFRRIGLTVLMNEHCVITHNTSLLIMAGVTDYGAGAFDRTQASDPTAALRGAPDQAAVRIVLAHQPRSASAAAAAGFDLQLSGHTHGGQFWPWKYFIPLQQPFTAGLHRLGAMHVYVSRGTGYWGPPLRLGAPSEITRIRLTCAQACG